MADIYIFFEEGIKSYIEQTFLKYSNNAKIIFRKSFDNILLRPLFLNDISLYKNLIQKNKLKSEIWGLIGNLLEERTNLLLKEYDESISNMKKKILEYNGKIKKSKQNIIKYKEENKEIEEEINNNNKENNEENEINKEEKEKEDLSDVNCKEYNSKNNGILINKIIDNNQNIKKEKHHLHKYKDKLSKKEKYIIIGEINILKLKMIKISVNILVNDIINQKANNKNYNKENIYKIFNDLINDFIDKCETIKNIIYIEYYTFIRVYIIELPIQINMQGYKDINKFFLNQLLSFINNIKKKYSNSHIYEIIKTLEKLISNPDTILCPNAFKILKDASFKKIKPRSRNNSFDKNDLVNNNLNNKNENNRKIDEFIKIDYEKKSDSEDDEEDFQKKLANIISFKNSSMQNNNSSNIIQNNHNSNINFQSQSSLGLGETNKFRSFPNDSALSNNSLINLENQNYTNVLNSSKMSFDDSMSMHSMFKSGSCSELLGINSRLASQLPILRNTKQQKNNNNLEFKKKIKIKKENNIQRKNSNEKLDKIFRKEFRKIINNNFYDNNICNKDKNTTATETKNNKISDEKIETKIISSDILVVKTPIKAGNEIIKEKEDIKNSDILKETGIKRNLELLFNQQTD